MEAAPVLNSRQFRWLTALIAIAVVCAAVLAAGGAVWKRVSNTPIISPQACGEIIGVFETLFHTAPPAASTAAQTTAIAISAVSHLNCLEFKTGAASIEHLLHVNYFPNDTFFVIPSPSFTKIN